MMVEVEMLPGWRLGSATGEIVAGFQGTDADWAWVHLVAVAMVVVFMVSKFADGPYRR